MKHLIFLASLVFILAGCAGKEFYEPEDTVGDFEAKVTSLNGDIIYMNRDGATLDSGEVISKQGVSEFKIEEGYQFLNISEGVLITSNYKDSVMLDKEVIEIGGVVIAATLKENKLALLLSDNSIQLYDTQEQKFVLKEYSTPSLVNDTRIANPYFMSNIILFPTLDGKIIVVSEATNKVIRNVVVDADGQFNNIIFLDVINDTLVAATTNKVISVGDGLLNIKDYQIRDIISNGDDIFIATIDGQIIKTDISLNIMDRKKFKYAKIYALAYGTSLYALESQGYLINISSDFQDEKIYDFSFDNEKKVIALEDKIYFNDEFVILK